MTNQTLVSTCATTACAYNNGRVGACQRLECVHNKDLLCTAPAIDVAGDTAECASFTAR